MMARIHRQYYNTGMTISVVIPAYNEEKYLSNTFKSLDRLHRKPDEVVVIDGGSGDKTVSIAKKYGAKVYVEKKRGIGLARDIGLKKATSDIVAYTDADTRVNKYWLDRIARNLSRPGVVATYGGYKVTKVDEGFTYINFINFINPVLNKITSFFNLHLGGGQNIAFWRKKGLQVGGFPNDFRSVEDFEMLDRLSKIGKVYYDDNNYVQSSGRRAYEGPRMVFRVAKGMIRYFLTGKGDKFYFPDVR